MNYWVVNGKYVVLRTTRTVLEKVDLWNRCTSISREDLIKEVHMPDEAKEWVNCAFFITKEGQIDTRTKMYFIE